MNWILFGFKNTGKTYLGSRLGLPFLDTDILISQKEGMSPRDMVLQRGEKYFRDLEKEVISSLKVDQTVIAIGGGAILDKQNLFYLQGFGKMIYLKWSKEKVKERILTPPLPSFIQSDNPEESFERMYTLRKPMYEKIAQVTIELDGKEEKEILEELWQAIDLDKFSPLPLGENLMVKP